MSTLKAAYLNVVFVLLTLSQAVHAFDASSSKRADELHLTTFNIPWYGAGGKPGGVENRDVSISALIRDYLSDTDVFMFQEVVDPSRLETNLLPQGFTCRTYQSSNPTHQYVVACIRAGLKFLREPTDNNDIIDEVSSDGSVRSRPALHLLVANSRNKPLLRLVGVHLKAMPNETSTRLEQTQAMANYLSRLDSDLPIVITGDFNTFGSDQNGHRADDNNLMSDILSRAPLSLAEAPANFTTYRTLRYASHFDRFWVSPNLRIVSNPQTFDVCQYSPSVPAQKAEIQKYNTYISDHCAVSMTVRLPR